MFVTQEERSSASLRELMNDLSVVRTVNFDTKLSNYAVHGLESPLRMATLTALTSIVFLIFLMCFNNIFVSSEKSRGAASEKMTVLSEKKVPKDKTPSSVVDILLLSSFVIAIACSTFLAFILRWKRLTKSIPPVSQKRAKSAEPSQVETMSGSEKHEIHLGGRPNFQGAIYNCLFFFFFQF